MSIVFAYYLRALSGDMLCMAKASVKCALIERVKAKNNSCPCCKQGNFDDFPNKGLQQPLYGFQVHCTNKEIDCQWTGELRLSTQQTFQPESEQGAHGPTEGL